MNAKAKKHFLPIIFISLAFLSLMVAQMFINGKELGASKIEASSEKYSAFEVLYRELDLKTSKGTNYKLKDVNQPIVILNFWASWCRPCVAEFETLNQLLTKFGNEVLVVGINNDDEEAAKAVSKIENTMQLKFESVLDNDSELTSKFYISAIPASIVYYKGKVIHYVNKEFNFMSDDFISKLESHLKE